MGCGQSSKNQQSSLNDSPLPPPPAKSAMKTPTIVVDTKSDEEMERKAAAIKLQALARGRQERKQVNAQKKSRRTSNVGGNAMNALAMKFPAILASYNALFAVFKKYKSEGETLKDMVIEKGALGAAMQEVAKKEFKPEEFDEMFAKGGVNVDEQVRFREFLIGTSQYFMSSESEDEDVLRIGKGFAIIKDTFSLIDKDGGGEISRLELKSALCDTSTGGDEVLLNARFGELDFNDDKEVDVNEFLWAMGHWVGFTGEDAE